MSEEEIQKRNLYRTFSKWGISWASTNKEREATVVVGSCDLIGVR